MSGDLRWNLYAVQNSGHGTEPARVHWQVQPRASSSCQWPRARLFWARHGVRATKAAAARPPSRRTRRPRRTGVTRPVRAALTRNPGGPAAPGRRSAAAGCAAAATVKVMEAASASVEMIPAVATRQIVRNLRLSSRLSRYPILPVVLKSIMILHWQVTVVTVLKDILQVVLKDHVSFRLC
jgi:hypothetical protein